MVQSCSFVLLSVRTISLMHIRILRDIPTAENEGLPCLNPRCPTCQNSSICSFFIEKKQTRCINVTIKSAPTENTSFKNILLIQWLRNILSIEIPVYKLIINGYNFVKFFLWKCRPAHITFKSILCAYNTV